MNRGFALLRSRQFSDAADAFTRAVEMDPDNAEAYNHRGVARAYEGKIDDAISDYSQALRVKPDLVGALNNRGSAYYQKGLLNQAISDYSKAIEINPYLAEAYSNRGTAWAAKGDNFRAIRDYTQALEANPYFDAPYYNRGRALRAIGDYDQAIGDLQRVIELNPTFHDAYHLLAKILSQCPDPKYRNGPKAVVLAKKAVDLKPNPEYLSTLAGAYAETGQFDHAISTQQRAVEILLEQGKTVQAEDYRKRLGEILTEKQGGQSPVQKETAVKVLPAAAEKSVVERKEEKQALSKKAPALAKSKKKDTTGAHKKGATVKNIYTVQAGAFLSEENADKRRMALLKKGYGAKVVRFIDRKARTWHTVRIGEYESMKKARKVAKTLAAKEKIQTSVRPGGSL